MSNPGETGTSPNADDSRQQPAPRVRRRKRRRPPLSVWIVVVACVAAIALLRLVVDMPAVDAAVKNVATLILGFIAAMTLLVWFSWRSGHSRRTRLTPIGVLLAAVAVAAAVLRIDNVNSGLVPSFRWRWQPKADQLLGHEPLPAGPPAVDLASTTAEDFPQFLGPRRDATVSGIELARDWQAEPPERVWGPQPIGAGWSAFAVVGQHAVTLEQRGTEELVSCYALLTGAVEWVQGIQARHESTLGGVGPRSTPTIHDGKVYALGATGVLRALDGATGHVLWTHDLLREFGNMSAEADMTAVAWGRAASPLVVDRTLVVPAGGPSGGPYVSLVAYDLDSGREVWRGGDRQVSYASPSLITLGGQRQIVIVNEGSITGHEPETGRVLWEQEWPGTSNASASCSQTVPIDERRLFVSKGYGGGALLFEVVPAGAGWTTGEIWHNRRSLETKFTNVVRAGDYIYGLSDGTLECIDLERGQRQWKRGRYGHGQILLVGQSILVLGENGELALVEANPRQYAELARIQALEGKTWNTLTLAGSLLLVRNAEQACCYRLPLAGVPSP